MMFMINDEIGKTFFPLQDGFTATMITSHHMEADFISPTATAKVTKTSP
jgi:hypothetical protein